jgi:2-polyprenyl-6-hydroxyphenyl methylase / 3-demethylubiquinone-9 3-methyltransferase
MYHSRLLPVPHSVSIDNELYDHVDWWAEYGPVSLLRKMNYVRLSYFAKHLPLSGRVLDVGCGGGLVSEELAVMGFSVTGIDISEKSIDSARKHASRSEVHLDLKYEFGDAMNLPYPDASFDGVVVSDVLEHLHDLPRAIAEIHRVLRSGGVVVFDTINRTPFSYVAVYLIAQELLSIVPRSAHDPALFVKPSELVHVLEYVGFEASLVGWSGIVPHFAPVRALRAWDSRQLIYSFSESSSDLSGSYQGWARKL